MRIAVVGAGSWGTALGIVAGRAGHAVKLWSRNAEVVESVNRERVNTVYLAPHEIPEGVRATCELAEALAGAEIVVLAAPSHVTRSLLARMLPEVRPEMIFVSATKA